MTQTNKKLPETNLPPPDLIEQAGEIEPVENFFVGLPDSPMPRPRNLLVFRSGLKGLEASPMNASHQRHLLVFSLEAEATTLLNGVPVPLAPGQALLIFPFQAHRYLLSDAPRVTWLFVSFELLETDALDRMRHRSVDVPPDLWPFLEKLITEYRRADAAQEPGGEAAVLLAYLLLRMRRACERTPIPATEPRWALASHRVVQQASQYIAGHLAEPITVAQIAAAVSVSGGHLRTCFRRVLGVSVSTYLRRTRAQMACSLLSRTESNITQIGERCGFASIYAFSRAFKREIGMSPRAYRKHLWESGNRAEGAAAES